MVKKLIQMRDIWGKTYHVDEQEWVQKSMDYSDKVHGNEITLQTYTKTGRLRRNMSMFTKYINMSV